MVISVFGTHTENISKTGDLLEMQILRPHPQNNGIRSPRGVPSTLCCFPKLARWF